MSNWHDRHRTAADHEHERELRKHDDRPGDRGFSAPRDELPVRLSPPIAGALEIAILAQSVPLMQAAELIEQYARTEAAAARLDATATAIDKCCAAIEAHGGSDAQA